MYLLAVNVIKKKKKPQPKRAPPYEILSVALKCVLETFNINAGKI